MGTLSDNLNHYLAEAAPEQLAEDALWKEEGANSPFASEYLHHNTYTGIIQYTESKYTDERYFMAS